MDDLREPPYDLESEEAVLGSILIDPGAMYVVAPTVTHEDFYREKHRWVMKACESLFRRGEPVNQTLLGSELKRTGELEKLGGADYINGIVLNATTSVHADYYAKVVKRLSTMRGLIGAAEKIADMGYEASPDIDTTLSEAQQLLLGLSSSSGGGFRRFSDISGGAIEYVGELFEKRFMVGTTTGFASVDRAIGGYRKGNLYLVAARSGMGKTQYMMQSAARIAKKGHGVGICSLEMTETELMMRVAYPSAGISEQDLRVQMMTNQLGMEEEDEKRTLLINEVGKSHELPIWVDDSPGQTTWQIQARLMALMNAHPIDVLFVDHLSLASDNQKEKNVKRLDDISYRFKCIAKEKDIPVVAMCQLNRQPEYRPDKRPMLSDLRDSGGLEQNSDVVLMLYRDEVYNKDTESPNTLEILYRKNRQGSPKTNSFLRYMAGTGEIKEMAL